MFSSVLYVICLFTLLVQTDSYSNTLVLPIRYIQENYSKIRDVERELANLTMEMKLTSGPKKAGSWVMHQSPLEICDICLCIRWYTVFLYMFSTWTHEKENWDFNGENSCCKDQGRRSTKGLLSYISHIILSKFYYAPCLIWECFPQENRTSDSIPWILTPLYLLA